MQRLLTLGLLVGLGLLPTAAVAQPFGDSSPTLNADQVSEIRSNSDIRVDVNADQVRTPEAILHEYAFIGNTDEIIVIYLDWPRGQPTLHLYDQTGALVESQLPYPDRTVMTEWRGSHRAFRLPNTGEYRLVLNHNGWGTAAQGGFDFQLQVRAASEYEQLSIRFAQLSDEQRYEDILPVLADMMALAPEQPRPYLWRVWTYAQLAISDLDADHPVFQPRDAAQLLAAFHDIFQAQSGDIQTLVLADLHQAAQNYLALADDETVNLGQLQPELLVLLADLLETGEASPHLVDILQNW